MKISKITLATIALVSLFSVSFLSLVPSTANALTKTEKKDCQKWEGNYASDSTKVKNYRQSKCPSSKGGNCTDQTHRVPNESGSGEQVRTTITCPINSPGGDGATGSSNTATGCDNVKTTLIDCTDHEGGPIVGMLVQLINFLAVGVGIAVVGGIIWGGITYASSNGDASKIQQGKTIIINAIVGLLLFFFMYAFLNYLVPGGLFS